MNEGKKFEKNIKSSVPSDVYYLRLPDPAVGFDINANTDKSKQRFSPKCPFDIILYKKPDMFCIELKSKEKKRISFSGANPDIKQHQIKALTEASKICNAGFLFNFRTSENTYYMSIQNFNDLIKTINKKSLNENNIRPLALSIPHTKLISNYKYDLNTLFESQNII